MPRLFLALDLPDALDMQLQLMIGGIHGARWQQPEQLHLTLIFLGDVDGGDQRRLIAALDRLDAPAFEMRLRGAGVFPPRGKPRVVWLGVAEPEPVRLVYQRCAAIVDRLGLEREHRKFSPHVTLARLGKHASEVEAGEWVSRHALYASEPFLVDHVRLYSSVVSAKGAKYRTEAAFSLST